MVYDEMEELRTALADRYRIIEEAGRGGMATVYRAEDIKHQREVAMKVLSADMSHTIGADRFQREIHIAARLQHPHILPVFDSGEAGGLLFYVMPFVTGEALRARIDRQSQLPIEDAVNIIIEVAGALGYAHSKGVIHRDIKPENILIEQGHAVVADFGIAHAAAESGEKLTATGMSVGTAHYMAPEQFGGSAADARSDIYSLGCTLYEMLVGQVPFTGPNMMAIMARHSMEQVPLISVVRSSVPADIEDAIYRALEKTPADRFQTMDEFKQALLSAGSATLTRTRAFTSRYQVPAGALAKARPWYRKPIALAAAATVLAAGLGAAARFAFSREKSVTLDANKVAVLYFEDRSETDTLRFLADALTESLIDQLTDAGGLQVISRAGVEPFRGHAIDDSVNAIATRLGVGSVVVGSVEPRGNGVQVRVSLLDQSGSEIESRTFRHASGALLALRDSVAPAVGEFLRGRLGQTINVQERRGRTRSVDAWVLAQRAEQKRKDADRLFAADSASRGLQALADADSMLRNAEQIDRRWADPLALRARLAGRRARALRSSPDEARAAIDSGIGLANRALDLDNRYADALEMRGTLRFLSVSMRLRDPNNVRAVLDSAEQDLLAAVRWRPTQATAWATLSSLYYRKPDVAEAKNAAVNAYKADAYLTAADQILTRLFWTNYDQQLFAESKNWCDEGRRRFPTNAFFFECQLWLQTAPKGIPIDPDRAWALRDSMTKYTAPNTRAIDAIRAEILVAGSLARAGAADSARRVLLKARENARQLDPDRELAGNEAVIRVILGDRAEAVKLIKEYLTVHPDHRSGFASGTGWWWLDLQSDPEFRRLVQASG
ncbi:MAG TPA: serine/threonine-protein kinase [Gemmatimonadaceae bacterium]|nr:serine/threonine-protein kinase [Gemmatimonadaceae bacterium]